MKITNSKMLLIGFLIGIAGFWLGQMFPWSANTPQQTTLKTMNSWYPSTEDPLVKKQLPYLTYQIKYPSSYYVTYGETLEDYLSMGSGGGTPSVIVTKGYQFTEGQQLGKLYEGNTDCILIWRQPVVDIEAVLPESDIKIESSAKQVINEHTVVIRTMENTKTKNRNYLALVHLPQDVLYGFGTCNDKNKDDLLTVLEHFNIRGR